MPAAMYSVPVLKGGELTQYSQQTVAVVGQVTSVAGSIISLRCADGSSVQVKRAAMTPISSQFVMIKGVPLPEGVLQEVQLIPMGDNFDLQNYGAMVDLCQNSTFKGMFVS
mmetsp:Transcript_13044/g.40182  ORF Transcript_13044/g.40182 Transcript_13044/m.40182 type:complete len:111 (+) Transcript_13044:105-437(+)